MERISLGGRTVGGFALSADSGSSSGVSPAYAAVATGAAIGLLAHVLHAPLWGSIAAGAGAALVTKVGIDRAASTA